MLLNHYWSKQPIEDNVYEKNNHLSIEKDSIICLLFMISSIYDVMQTWSQVFNFFVKKIQLSTSFPCQRIWYVSSPVDNIHFARNKINCSSIVANFKRNVKSIMVINVAIHFYLMQNIGESDLKPKNLFMSEQIKHLRIKLFWISCHCINLVELYLYLVCQANRSQ